MPSAERAAEGLRPNVRDKNMATDLIPIAWFDISSVYPFACTIVNPDTRQNLYYSNK